MEVVEEARLEHKETVVGLEAAAGLLHEPCGCCIAEASDAADFWYAEEPFRAGFAQALGRIDA